MPTAPSVSLFSFPFWVFTDRRNPPESTVISFPTHNVRVYPPFRSAPANAVSMPPIRASAIPDISIQAQPPNASDFMMTLAAIPQLAIPGVQDIAITLVAGPELTAFHNLIAVPMDSLRIDVIPTNADAIDEIPPDPYVKLLVSHLRVKSLQWWMGLSTDALTGWKRNIVFADAPGGFTAAASGYAPSGSERPIDRLIWNSAMDAVGTGFPPPVASHLLLDARYFAAVGDFRRSCIDAATACEIAANEAVQRIWERKKTIAFKRGKVFSGYDMGRHLDNQLWRYCGRSLRTEHPDVFTVVGHLWDARGNVAHGKPAYFIDSGKYVQVDSTVANSLLPGAVRCVEWLDSL
jgi:hypothetical protein